MGRATVRAAIQSFFTGQVANLNAVYSSEPRAIAGDVILPSGSPTGAVSFVFIESEHETRRALGGPTSGTKQVTYGIALVVFLRSTRSGQAAMDDFDTLIDAIKSRLRSDRNLGNANVIFQGGEGDTVGAVDIAVHSVLPVTKGNQVRIDAAVRFTVVEMIAS